MPCVPPRLRHSLVGPAALRTFSRLTFASAKKATSKTELHKARNTRHTPEVGHLSHAARLRSPREKTNFHPSKNQNLTRGRKSIIPFEEGMKLSEVV